MAGLDGAPDSWDILLSELHIVCLELCPRNRVIGTEESLGIIPYMHRHGLKSLKRKIEYLIIINVNNNFSHPCHCSEGIVGMPSHCRCAHLLLNWEGSDGREEAHTA